LFLRKLCDPYVTNHSCGLAWLSGYAILSLTDIEALMLDCDPAGENGAKQSLWKLAQRCKVRLAWSSDMHGGRLKGRQPESLSIEE
jgi:hypothetical protein